MNSERAAERAREKANELLLSLDLTDDERETVRSLYMTMLGAVNKNRDFWRKVDDRTIRLEVIPSAAAMLTAYTDELVKAMREDDEAPPRCR